MILQAFAAFLLVNGVSTERTLVIGDSGNGHKIPIDITVQDGSVITVSGQPFPPQPFFRQSINLYDFDQHLEARKVIEEGTCYIRMFKGSYGQMKKVVDAAKSKHSKMTTEASEDWNIPGKAIKDDELKSTVGAKIAEFCSGYKVFWVHQNKKVTEHQARMAKRQWSVSSNGLNYNFGNGLSGNLGASFSHGFSVSAGLTWTFGK